MIPQQKIIRYAMTFGSFIIDSNIGKKVNRIILFGSVARGDFNEESDIDLFIDADPRIEKEVEQTLTLFRASRAHETAQLEGIRNEFSVHTGHLAKWSMHREVISSGILLYGKYNELPPGTAYYACISTEGIAGKKKAQQIKIFRTLYGYKQKVGKKTYTGKGLVEDEEGTKIGRGVFIIPMERRQTILSFLNKNKVQYKLYELWSDAFTR